MGKALLIVTLSAVLAGGVIMLQAQDTERQTDSAMAGAEAEFLAREAARSGYEVGMGEALLDFSGREGRLNVQTADIPQGSYDLEVEQTDDATLVVTAMGHASHRDAEGAVRQAEHTLRGELVRLVEMPGAVVIDAEEVVPMFIGDAFAVSGLDRRPLGTSRRGAQPGPGLGAETHAMLATQPGIATLLRNELSDTQELHIRGRSDESEGGAIAEGDGYPALLQSIYDEAMTRVSASAPDVIRYVGDRIFAGAETFGSSPLSPKIVHVAGNALVKGRVRGHGVLIVEGDLTIEALSSDASDNFAWEGLVYVRHEGEVSYSQTGATRIDGALVVQAPPAEATGDSIDFDIDEDGEIRVNERFAARVEVLGAAISAGGAYDVPVTLELTIGGDTYTPWGNERRAVDGNVNDDQNPRSFDVPNIYDAGERIKIEARSFLRRSGRSGRRNSDWYEHLTVRSGGGNHELVKVLRNGDRVPQIGGFLNQTDIAGYVADYVVDGRISLADNQAIYLFELGETDTRSNAADFQDAVVLVTLSDEEELSAGAGAESDDCACKQAHKVAIIHYPPGNPGNAHLLCVGAGAVPAHFGNHNDEYCTPMTVGGATDGAGAADDDPATERLSVVNFTLGGEATVQYSAEALGRLATHLQSARTAMTVQTLKQRSYDPVQPHEPLPTRAPRDDEDEEEEIEGDAPVTVCVNGETVTITVGELEQIGGEVTLGRCLRTQERVTICHLGRQTLEISDRALLPAHLAHGDVTGACRDDDGSGGPINGGTTNDGTNNGDANSGGVTNGGSTNGGTNNGGGNDNDDDDSDGGLLDGLLDLLFE